MKATEERYISLLTDFGFKRIFGSTPNKELLINFLNTLFGGTKVVKDIKYLNTEHMGEYPTRRKAVFDVFCEGENGENFIVEMQNAYQEFFKDRSLFYSTFPIREQAVKGDGWDYRLNHVYTIALLNFEMQEKSFNPDKISHTVQLCDIETNKVFYEKLDFIYVEIAKFNKTEDELVSLYDKWLYVLKNLSKLEKRPKALLDKIFDKLFKEAEIARFNEIERKEYETSLKEYLDYKNQLETNARDAKREGHEEGFKEGVKFGFKEGRDAGCAETTIDLAKKMKTKGISFLDISEMTGLTEKEIRDL